ncbi:hypothetical protein [Aestuariivirga sp.]|uniref:hypothetical protein n=1 Tax=Aestuariivirga sp. TaxID=2650926 RepID=UPI0039E53B7A
MKPFRVHVLQLAAALCIFIASLSPAIAAENCRKIDSLLIDAKIDIAVPENQKAPLGVVVFLDELMEHLSKKREYCGYDREQFRIFVVQATVILWGKQDKTPILPHTAQAISDRRLAEIWSYAYSEGKFGFEKNPAAASCWVKNGAKNGKECLQLDKTFGK